MNDTFMKTRPVLPLLVSMALPNVISMLVNSLYNIVDSLFVARISEQAMTALSLVFPVQNLVNAISIGFGIGINAQIALHLGAGDREKADISATHGMALSILHGSAVHCGRASPSCRVFCAGSPRMSRWSRWASSTPPSSSCSPSSTWPTLPSRRCSRP